MASIFIAFLAPLVAGTPVAAEAASASSTFASGNVVGSPEYGANNALSSGSAYWCSAGSHSPGETVTLTAQLASARSLSAVQINWAHAPNEVRVLTSPDGSNFEEAACWRKTGKADDSFVETLEFNRAYRAKVVTIAMRGARKSGYMAIGDVAFESSASEASMVVSGVTSTDEMCLVAENGSSDQRGALLTAEACGEAIAAGDGRELFVMTESGQLKSAGGLCAILAGNSAAGGGEIELDDCEAAAETGDGRSFWGLTPQGQLSMGGGSYCMVVAGGAAFGGDVAPTSTWSASATGDSAHGIEKITDGSADSFWQSPPADSVGGPVTLSAVLAQDARVSSVVIDWNEPAGDFTVQTATDGGQWSTFAVVKGNTLQQSIVRGPSVVARKLRIMMSAPVDGESGAFSAKSVRVVTAALKMGVQDCAEASLHGDARDLYFAEPAPEFDPLSSASMRGTASLLEGAVRQLGELTAELSALKPKIEACKKGSFLSTRS